MKSPIIAPAILLTIAALSAAAQDYRDSSLSPDERARLLVAEMTLEEKLSQLQHKAPAIERLGVPAYNWWNENLHGVGRAGTATVFPQAIGMAATFSPEDVLETFDMVSTEQRAKYNQNLTVGADPQYRGLTVWTPNINIFRDPRWGRGQETYGEDPYLTSRMGLAVVRGLQGDPDARYNKLHACAKHFAVHSGPEWNRHTFNADSVSARDLWETYLPAFKALVIEGKVKEVMCAYNRFEGEPCCANTHLLKRILRDDWGYDDVVVSDCAAVTDFYRPEPSGHGTHPDRAHAAADAMLTGNDLECDGPAFANMQEAIESGLISEEQVDRSLIRLMRARFQLGSIGDDSLTPWASYSPDTIASPRHRAKALDMARKSMTLLKNSGGVLPLSTSVRKIAVVGPNANDSTMMWGNYNGTPVSSVTILDGIRNEFPAAEIVYTPGCHAVDPLPSAEAYMAVADSVADADVIIFAGGLSPRLEGEEMPVDYPGFRGGDRTRIELPAVQTEMMKALKATGRPVVFVLCAGSQVAIPWEAGNVDAILDAYYPGEAGGRAVAEVLSGTVNPAGRLPFTFYASTDDLPDYLDYDMYGRTYRYFQGTPLYPFGHGLSYTDFSYGSASLSSPKIKRGETVTLTIPVSNIGSRDGGEVVQVYISNPQDPAAAPRTLRAFRRVAIPAGETAQVSISLPASTFEFFDPASGEMTVSSGEYGILYGGSSDPAALKSTKIKIR